MKNAAIICIGLLCAASAGRAAEDSGFKPYQLILDRQPFGQEPPEADMVQVAPSQSFARNLRLSMLFEAAAGDIRAGIVDTAANKSYILRTGTSEDGLELIEADLTASEAMIRKDNEVALFKLESGESEAITKGQQAVRRSSYEERRRNRAAATAPPDAPAKPQEPLKTALTGEALRKHLEQVQMDAIRQGLPPLPMQLTPEMDAQLVAEGVLPPQ